MSDRRRRSRSIIAQLTLAFGLAPAFATAAAQTSTTGAIAGHITDPGDQPIAAAWIEILGPATSRRLQLRTSAAGDFLATSLPPSDYIVHIQAPGYIFPSSYSVRVEVAGTSFLRASLLPTVSTEVTVVTSPDEVGDPIVATSSVISGEEIRHLPTDGRRWQTFAQLTPQANPGSSSADVGLLAFHGIAPTQNSSRLDGVDDDQSFNATPHGSGTDAGPEVEDETESEGGSKSGNSGRSFSSGSGAGARPGAEYTFSQAAVQEFRVVGQNDSSLYGHAAGGVITTISRSGTDTFHGSAFYFVRESAWAATNPFSLATQYSAGVVTSGLVKPADQRQQLGAILGGPLLARRYPHRFFFFLAADAQRRYFPAVSSPEDPNFYNLTPTQTALLGNRGVTSTNIAAALTYLDSLTGTVPRRADQTVYFLKLDARLTQRNQLTLQGNRASFNSPSGIRSAAVVDRATRSFGNETINTDSLLLRWMYTRHVNLANEFRLHLNHDLHSDQAQTPLPQEPSIATGGLSPEIAIGPQGFYFGTPASLGKRAAPDERRLQFADIAMLSRGRHFFQTGFEWSVVHDRTDSLTNTDGTFHYDSGATDGHAGGLVDWITDYTFNVNTYPNGGCPSIHSAIHYFCFRTFSQSFGQQVTAFSTQELAGFFQERWRPSETLAFTAGLRYEYELLPFPQQPNPAVDATFAAEGATSIFPEDRNNLGPRIAAAWQPFGERQGTVHVAYGVYFGRLPGATIRSALADTATSDSATRIRILPSTITACPQVANQGFGYPCTYTASPPAGVTTTTSTTVFSRRFRLPMVQQGSFALERDLGHVASLSATYLLNLDRQLPNSVDINIAPSTENRTFQLQGGNSTVGVRDGDTFVLPAYTQRINTSFGPVTAITSNANGSYNALALGARHRSREGLEFRVNWTWSKALDFGQNSGSVPRTNSQLDPYQLPYDKGLSAFNYPHKIVASAIWQPPPVLSSTWARRLTSDWLVASILNETSGRPYSYNTFGGTRLSGGHESINGSGGDVYLPTVGRNTLRLPDSFNIDLRLSRELRLSDTMHLHAIAEAFNLTNHVNYSSITERAFLVGTAVNGITPLTFQNAATVSSEGLNNRPFGAYTSSSSQTARERQLQLGLRLDF